MILRELVWVSKKEIKVGEKRKRHSWQGYCMSKYMEVEPHVACAWNDSKLCVPKASQVEHGRTGWG